MTAGPVTTQQGLGRGGGAVTQWPQDTPNISHH